MSLTNRLNELNSDLPALWCALMQRWKRAEDQSKIAAQICSNLPTISNEFRSTKLVEEEALKELVEIKKLIDEIINSTFKNRLPLDGLLTIATIQTNYSLSTRATALEHADDQMGAKLKRA